MFHTPAGIEEYVFRPKSDFDFLGPPNPIKYLYKTRATGGPVVPSSRVGENRVLVNDGFLTGIAYGKICFRGRKNQPIDDLVKGPSILRGRKY